MPRVIELLEQYRPDLVCLQETKSEPDAFPGLELASAGYHAVHHSAGRWAGVALLAPKGVEIANVCAGLEGEPARDEARWIEADVDGVRAVSVYVPNGQAIGAPAFADKLRFLEAILDAGLVDSFRRLHPDAVAYTWWDYRAGNFHKGLGLRIDYLLTTRDLADEVKRCGIARDYRKGKKPSDHAPLMAQIGGAGDGIEIPDASDSKQV